MRLHLPYTESPDEEFQGPSGEWFCHLRAITLDNWLIWRHALPGAEVRRDVPLEIACNITALGARIAQVHQRFPNYRLLMDTPFHVSRWWDPHDPGTDWAAGRAMLCRIDGFSAQEIARYCSKQGELITRICSAHWIELRLAPDVEAQEHSLIYTDGDAAAG